MSTLLYAMGDCAGDILATLRLDETKARYDQVRAALNGYFDVRRNLIVQRALFITSGTIWQASQRTHSFKIYTGLQKTASAVR